MLLHRVLPIATFLLAACSADQVTTLPTMGPITESVYASGVVKAAGQYKVYPTVTGPVLALLVQEGDTVRAGTALLHIDDRSSRANERSAAAQLQLLVRNASDQGPVLAQLRQALEQARERYVVDSANVVRQRALWAQQIGSRAELDQRELAFTSSRTAWRNAARSLEETRARLRTELEVARNTALISAAGNADRTPQSLIDGLVYDLLVEPGELATPQQPVAIIGSATDLYLELEVDERDIARVKVGQEVAVTLELYREAFPATITRIVPLMDARTRTFTVEARFTQAPPQLYPNLTAEANIILDRKARALTIPASYLLPGDSVGTGTEERTAVQIGLRDLDRVEVLGGIDSTTVLFRP
jgi:multidrug efflux pump subunit AcrA (membrane-fusion protein)